MDLLVYFLDYEFGVWDRGRGAEEEGWGEEREEEGNVSE